VTAAILEAVDAVDRTACPGRRHGTRSAYTHAGCKCPDARAAHNAYTTEWFRINGRASRRKPDSTRRLRKTDRVYPPGLVDSTATAERLRVLAALGYAWGVLAAGLGYKGWTGIDTVVALATQTSPSVDEHTAAQVRKLFGHLIAMPAPCGYGTDCALQNAVRKGWGVVDMVAVRRALAGEHVPLTALERRAAVWAGQAEGALVTAICTAARISGATATCDLAA
jgi:hypothetical protein